MPSVRFRWFVTALGFAGLVLSINTSTSVAQSGGALTVKVAPATRTMLLGSRANFKATLTGPGAKEGVEWLVGGVVGGDDTVGRIVATGNTGAYTAPALATLPKSVQITARAKANPSSTGSSTVTLALPPPTVSGVFPPKIATGAVNFRIEGAYFTSGCRVKLGKLELTTSVHSANLIYAGAVVPNSSPPSLPLVVFDSSAPTRKSPPKNVAVSRNSAEGLNVADAALSIRAGLGYEFRASYMGNLLEQAQWYVNGTLWGSDVYGRIDTYGRYRAPYTQPSNTTVEILAKSMDRIPKSGRAIVSVLPPVPTIRAAYPIAIRPTASLTLQGFGFLNGAKALINGVETPTIFYGYDALGVQISIARPASRRIYVQVVNPPPSSLVSNVIDVSVMSDPNTTSYSVDDRSAQRFLDQASFGPDDATRDRVREVGFSTWIDEQLGTTESTYPNIPTNVSRMMQEDFVSRTFARNMLRAPDQLRQRMVFFLGQHFVISDAKLRNEGALLEWQRMLSKNAFGNFRNMLTLVSLSPVMGRYLDGANSEKTNFDGSVVPNENYAREIMQLFTVGLVKLNRDGSPKLDAQGNTIPTYTQQTVKELSRALTGWGYPRDPARAFTWPTPVRYIGQMEPFEPVHDTGAKTLMDGFTIPAGGTVRSDLDATLNHLFAHPNLPPFIAVRMIRHFVKSNPSPAYIDRVANVFENNGRGVRGDMNYVLKAVLMDPEARNTTTTATDGKLREPILHLSAMLRALQAQPPANSFDNFATERVMGEKLLESPTVFNFFSPLHKIGTTGLYGPEFQTYTPVMAVNRANLIFRFLNGNFNDDIPLLLSPYQSLADDPTRLIDRVNNDFFRGRMSTALRNELIDSISRQTDDPKRRAMTALWLAVTSGEYAVVH